MTTWYCYLLFPEVSSHFIGKTGKARKWKVHKAYRMVMEFFHFCHYLCVSLLSICWEHDQIIIWEQIDFCTWMVYYNFVFSTCCLCKSASFRNGYLAWGILSFRHWKVSTPKKKKETVQAGGNICGYMHCVWMCTLHEVLPTHGRKEIVSLLVLLLNFALLKKFHTITIQKHCLFLLL